MFVAIIQPNIQVVVVNCGGNVHEELRQNVSKAVISVPLCTADLYRLPSESFTAVLSSVLNYSEKNKPQQKTFLFVDVLYTISLKNVTHTWYL
jgi:hypothetical protein